MNRAIVQRLCRKSRLPSARHLPVPDETVGSRWPPRCRCNSQSEVRSMALPAFRYRLEQQDPKVGNAGVTRGASVREFPISTGIAGVSMRLAPGTMRELHWHANAAEWAYVVSGSCRTTILHPGGSAYIDRNEEHTSELQSLR